MLLALAGMSAVTGLGDSPNGFGKGGWGLRGAVRWFPQGVCAGERVVGPGTAGGPPTGTIPLVLALSAPTELPLCQHRCSQTLARAGVRQLPMGKGGMGEVGTGSPLLPPVPQPCCPTCPAFPPRRCQGSSRPPPSHWRDPAASSPRSPTPPTLSGWWWLWPTVGARCSSTRPCRGRTLAPATHPCSVLRSLRLLQEPPVARRRAPVRAAAHRPCLHDAGGGSGHICLLSTQPGRPAGWGGHGVRGTRWPTPLQWAPALTGALQVRLGGWTPPGPPCGNSPGRAGSSP